VLVTVMDTTLGDTAAAMTDQLGAEESACVTGDGKAVALAVALADVCAVGDCVVETRVTAYVPVLARTAARAAMSPSSASGRSLAG
jgi:hypothetical protein